MPSCAARIATREESPANPRQPCDLFSAIVKHRFEERLIFHREAEAERPRNPADRLPVHLSMCLPALRARQEWIGLTQLAQHDGTARRCRAGLPDGFNGFFAADVIPLRVMGGASQCPRWPMTGRIRGRRLRWTAPGSAAPAGSPPACAFCRLSDRFKKLREQRAIFAGKHAGEEFAGFGTEAREIASLRRCWSFRERAQRLSSGADKWW